MSALERMLLRDLAHMKGQVIAVSMVVACGVASYVSMRSTYRSLLLTQSSYYEAYRFADIFAHVKRAPDALAATLRRIPGVAALETRITMEVTLDVPGLAEPATGLLVSIPEHRRPILNDLHIRRGEYPQPGRSDEVLASEAFTAANSLDVGSRIGAVINGRWKQLRISGIALSPEYIYEVRGGSILPDNKRFGVLWMPLPTLEAAFDMRGAFNDVALTLARGTNPADVISSLDRLLAPYGSLGAYGRDEQISNRFISDEIAQNRVSSNVIPAIFLGVAAFLLHIVLSRLIQIQRKEIALLKAFGYSRGAIGAHYLRLSLLAVSGGVALGIAGGLYFGSWITEVYQQFYRFPVLRYEAGPGLILTAAAISFAAAALGALQAVRGAMALPPAEAMRPESPALFHAGALEHAGVMRLLSLSGRMIVRNLNRRRGKAALSVLGIATAAGLMVVGFYFYDAFEYMIRVEFEVAERADVTVYFHDAKSEGARFEVARLPGVLRAEPFRDVPVRLRFGYRSKRSGILAMAPGSQLCRILDEEMRPVRLPEEGILLTERLARDLGVSAGDTVTVEVLEGRRAVRRIVVAGVTDELLGTSAYMSLEAIHRLMREGGSVSGAWLEVDVAALPRLYSLLKRTPAVSAVAIRDAMLQTFREIIAQSFTISTNILIVFACIISFGMVYNGARIALSERGNEMASLRVLGFTQGEVARILLGEQALLTVAAIPLGCLLGYGICAFLSLRLSTELYRIPLVVTRQVYLFSRGCGVGIGGALRSAGGAPVAAPGSDGGAENKRIMKRFLRRFLWFFALAGLAAALFFAMRPEPVEVEAARVTRGPLQVTVDEDGEAQSHDRFVAAAPVAGRLARIELHDGDAVALGQVLATLSPLPLDPKGREEAEARLRSIEALEREAAAQVERAQADLELQRRERERAEQLVRTGDIPRQTLDQRRNAESMAAKELEAARFRAQSAGFDVESAKAALLAVTRPSAAASKVLVRAPVKGHVLRVLEASERVVAAGTPLVLLGEESKHLEVVVDVLSTDAVKISPGAMMWLDGWGGPKPLRARVRRVEPYAFTKVSVLGIEEQRVNVIGDFLDPPGPLGDGYRVEARIVIWERQDVVKLPLSALFRQGSRWAVFRVENGRARISAVEVGHRNSLEAEVLGGIREGAEVVVHPSNELKEGDRVVIQQANSARSSIQ